MNDRWYSCLVREVRSKGETIALVRVSDWQKTITNLAEKGFDLVHSMPIPAPGEPKPVKG